jgi:hypothetical protein
LDDLDEVLPFGSVVQFVTEGQGILLIMPSLGGGQEQSIFDLDNLVCLPDSNQVPEDLRKMVLGFVSDVVGPIQMPLYSVALYEQSVA